MKTLDISTLTLASGAHKSIEQGACVMEAVSYISGEPWSDSPKCVSPLLAKFCRTLNDAMQDEERQQLKELIPILSGTNTGAADDQKRGLMCVDWIVRTYTPAWMELAGLTEQANVLRSIPEIKSWDALVEATSALVYCRTKSVAAWVAARAAARDAARAAAWDAAWDAAWAAARDAAGVAAGDAARVAAWDAARDAVGDAAWVATWDAARAAAGAAAGAALRPTVLALQKSAVDLAKRMAELDK
jgi:hypothetical protein